MDAQPIELQGDLLQNLQKVLTLVLGAGDRVCRPCHAGSKAAEVPSKNGSPLHAVEGIRYPLVE